MGNYSSELTKKDLNLIKRIKCTDECFWNILPELYKEEEQCKLNKKRFIKVYETLHPNIWLNLGDAVKDYIFGLYDTNKDGYVSYFEFIVGYNASKRVDEKWIIENTFNYLDDGNKGYLDFNDINKFANIFSGMRDDDDGSQFKNYFSEFYTNKYDKNSVGGISKDDFIKACSDKNVARLLSRSRPLITYKIRSDD